MLKVAATLLMVGSFLVVVSEILVGKWDLVSIGLLLLGVGLFLL